MTKNDLIKLTTVYIKSNMNLERLIERAVNSGCIDVDSIGSNDFAEIRAISHAVLSETTDNFSPLTTEGRKESENIQKFL